MTLTVYYSSIRYEDWTHPHGKKIFPLGLPGDSMVKNLPANAGSERDLGLIPGSGRSSGVGK